MNGTPKKGGGRRGGVKTWRAVLLSARVALPALRIAALVGTSLNLINQGQTIVATGQIDGWRFILNYAVPYCVASYSAARNELGKEDEE